MAKSTLSPEDIASHLLELHVQHEMAALNDTTFIKWLEEESETIFTWLKTVKLNQLVTQQSINETIHANVVEREIPGSIAEVAGEAATKLFTSDQHKNTLLNEIMTTQEVEEFVDKALELQEQRREGLNRIIDLPIYTDLISGVLYQAIVRYIYDNNVLSKKVPGVASMLKFGSSVISKTVPKLEGAVEDNVKSYISNNLGLIITESKSFLENNMTDEELKTSAMDLWDFVESKSLGELQTGIDSMDLSEFVVLGYEFWLRFRKSEYFKQSYELIVAYFYEKYGNAKLSVLFDDFLVTPERVKEEAERFAPKILAKLKKSGQLEGLIRRRLESFYNSDTALKYLAKMD
ncbi:hypothetical protein [Alkalimarinus sediminis]|uniref:Uncharacterized protein n=1 Tax=Alkalimarinus sediminis TaxID=1632866 RepID=A0A9E8HH36_9ALTE|nr:hypothetical protein [Alkalimarinus sediminis]UZW74304.1 hypothetical protein NNL22_14940 [Alkalimarinus sediminis]